MLDPFSNGSVCTLYFAPHIIRKAIPLSFVTPLHWYSQSVIQNRKWLFIKEYRNYIYIYISGRTCFSQCIIPTTRDSLFDVFLKWQFQVIFSLIASPRRSNVSTLSMSVSLYPPNNEVVGGYIGFTPSVCPSVRPSVCPACRVRSATSKVLNGFFPY